MKFTSKLIILLIISIMVVSVFSCTGKQPQPDNGNGNQGNQDRPDPNEGPIFSFDPKDGEKLLSKASVLRNIMLGNEPIKDPMLLGSDNKNNFIIYLQDRKEVIKLPKDASISVVILDDSKLNTANGLYISGHVRETRIVMLQKPKSGSNEYVMRYFDTSGNALTSSEFGFSNISALIKSKGIEVDSKYSFIAQDVFIMEDGNTAVTINEKSSDNKHIDINRPQFLIFSPDGSLYNVITIIPPNWTGFGTDYWKDSRIEIFHIDTAIYKNEAYILWGSGYSTSSTLGYMYQKVSLKSSGAGTYATRVLRSGQDKENRTNDTLPDKNKYASRGIWVDQGKVYIRLKLDDGTNIIDIYNARDDYREKFNLKNMTDLGETSLIGPNNMIVIDNYVLWASNIGVRLLDLTKSDTVQPTN